MKKLKALPVPPLVREAAVMLWANIVLAVAVFFFLMPSHASVSSIAGAAIVIANFVPLQISAITLILNVVLLNVGFLTCGREFGVKTVYTSVMLLQWYYKENPPCIIGIASGQETGISMIQQIAEESLDTLGRVDFAAYLFGNGQ